MRAFGWLLTMLAVVVAWVFFRAETLTGALRMLQGMAGTRPDADDLRPLLWNAGLRPSAGLLWCAVLGAIAFFAPNSNRIGMRVLEMVRHRAVARRLIGGAALTAVLLLVLINAARDSVSAFIYFNF
jgi:alginate O-acetyltransferase complex protein AlgI